VQNVGASAPLVQRAEMALRKDDSETPKEAQNPPEGKNLHK
jgi:hypothetical protein